MTWVLHPSQLPSAVDAYRAVIDLGGTSLGVRGKLTRRGWQCIN